MSSTVINMYVYTWEFRGPCILIISVSTIQDELAMHVAKFTKYL